MEEDMMVSFSRLFHSSDLHESELILGSHVPERDSLFGKWGILSTLLLIQLAGHSPPSYRRPEPCPT